MTRKKIKSELIDGFTYEVTQLGAIEGRRLLVKLSKVLLPALGALVKGADGNIADVDLSKIDLAGAAEALATAMDPDEFDRIVDQLAGTTEVWGPGFGDLGGNLPRAFDEHFSARYASMLKWLAFALKVNFSDFFDGKGSVAGLVAGLRSPVAPSASPSTSTGSSGG